LGNRGQERRKKKEERRKKKEERRKKQRRKISFIPLLPAQKLPAPCKNCPLP
jgi:hypothetical protein